MVTLFKINTLPFRYFFWIMVVQQSQNWGTLDLTLQRLWQLSCCSALPLQCPGYHLLSWLVAEFDRCCPVSPLRVIRESVSNDWIKDSENPNIQTGRSQNCQYLQNGLSRDSTSSRQWMNFWLRSSADVEELLLAPVRPGGAVCPLLQIGLQRGEAQHGPETPQLRDAHIHQVWHAHIPREELTVFLLQNTNPGFLSLSV